MNWCGLSLSPGPGLMLKNNNNKQKDTAHISTRFSLTSLLCTRPESFLQDDGLTCTGYRGYEYAGR